MCRLRFVFIDRDRYSGAYSGASWTAWIGEPPDEIDAGDPTCEEFWEQAPDAIPLHGRGDDPQEALRDLMGKTELSIGGFDLVFCDTFDGESRAVSPCSSRFEEVYPRVLSHFS